jgi:hypothetical protein
MMASNSIMERWSQAFSMIRMALEKKYILQIRKFCQLKKIYVLIIEIISLFATKPA